VIVSFSIDDLKQSIPEVAGLADLAEDALQGTLRAVLGRAAEGATISVSGKMVSLDYGELPESTVLEAQRLCEKAAGQAAKGELSKAASLYRRAIESNPSLQSARRALAMVLFEAGKPDDALDALIDALKSNPRDPQGLVILGNHYARQNGQQDVAIRLIRRACEVAPEDAVARNSLGGLLLEFDQPEEAIAEFNAALALDPSLANAWYGRSVAEIGLQRWAAARDSLQQMFAIANLADRRQETMLKEARDSFRRVSNIIGNDRAAESLAAASQLAARLGEATGQPVTVRETQIPGFLPSRSSPAWATGEDHHLVEIDERLPAEMVKHHLACRECDRMLAEAASRETGDFRVIDFPEHCRNAIRDTLTPDICRIATRKGYDPAKLSEVATGLAESFVSEIHQVVQNIGIERRLMNIEALCEAQFCSLLLQAHTAASITLDSPNREIMPPKLNTVRDTLAAVTALLADHISGGASDCVNMFAKSGVLPLARKIEALAHANDGPPGSEFDLIDQIAGLLGVRGWYEWKNEICNNSPETNPS
jgi:tetratricopeptide (TPR) repeat protein